jgi:hypothetical protein
MQDLACEHLRISLLGTWVNKGSEGLVFLCFTDEGGPAQAA